MTSPDFWAILQTLSSHSASAGTVFEILESGVSGSPSAIMADNYVAAIKLLNAFASAASSEAVQEQKADRKQTPQQRKAARPAKAEKSGTDKPAVARGVKAVNIIYSMTSRIPQLMKQSHLESNEGKAHIVSPNYAISSRQDANMFCSLVRLLAPHLPSNDDPVHQPLPRSAPPSLQLPPTLFAQSRTNLVRPRGMDGHLRGSPLPAHHPPPQARGLLVRPRRYERDSRASGIAPVQGFPSISGVVVEVGGHARSVGEDHRDYGPLDE